MQHLIISAHPSPSSFSNILVESLTNYSLQNRVEVVVRDLYKTGFDPLLAATDLAGIKAGEVPIDILVEQQLLASADIISIVYPLWWGSFPAVLKGYFDRVLTNGFAFKISPDGPVGLLNGKRVFLHTSMGNSLEEYERKGLLEAFKQIQGDEVFGFCGIEVADHVFYPQIPLTAADVRLKYIAQSMQRYAGVFKEEDVVSNL